VNYLRDLRIRYVESKPASEATAVLTNIADLSRPVSADRAETSVVPQSGYVGFICSAGLNIAIWRAA
jgi:hypothetical protein